MTWDTIQQLIRIVMYSGGSYWFGSSVASGDLYQAAIGGVVGVGAFVWWYVWDHNRPAAPAA